MKNTIYTYIFLLLSATIWAQSSGRSLSVANENYTNKNYVNAEASYRVAKSNGADAAIADYNMGNTLLKQKQYKEAQTAFIRAISNSDSRELKHKAYHNLGNSYMDLKDYAKAENAFKEALKNNPKDEETRYNYALAKELNKKDDQNQDNQDDQNKDNQDDQNKDNQDDQNKDNKDDQNKDNKDDKNKDNKDDQNKDNKNDQNKDNKDDQNKDNKDDQNKDNKDDQNKDNKDNQNKEQPQAAMSHAQIENILESLERDEKEVQQRIINKGKGSHGEKLPATNDQRKKNW